MAVRKNITQAATIFGCLFSRPLRISSWTASCFSSSKYIIQMSIPFCFVFGRAFRHFITTPATTSPAALRYKINSSLSSITAHFCKVLSKLTGGYLYTNILKMQALIPIYQYRYEIFIYTEKPMYRNI